jgi:DNA-binding CsgD family transcriptional regulator
MVQTRHGSHPSYAAWSHNLMSPRGLPSRFRAPVARGDPGDPSDAGGLRLALVLLLVVLALVGADLLLDDRSGADPSHLLLEGLLMALSAGGALALWLKLAKARGEARLLSRDVDAARAEAARWRAEAGELVAGLRQSMDGQFDRWRLTPAERQVALLLLKGLSHAEAARVRDTSERTVRQQAHEVYRKAGLSGRSELAAFFLEDLLFADGTASG